MLDPTRPAPNEALILYQGQIVQHARQPHNLRVMDNPTVCVVGDSPICGDHMTLYLQIRSGRVHDASFDSTACCAVCLASASMMTDALSGLPLPDVQRLAQCFHRLLQQGQVSDLDRPSLGPLTVFENLRKAPSRIECAALAWTTLDRALAADDLHAPQHLPARLAADASPEPSPGAASAG